MHNWKNLSDSDFEAVCRDVMGQMLSIPVEVFTRGRDGGVDLRARGKQAYIIGQCKHYTASTYSKLLSAAKDERRKLDELKVSPERYIFFTSQPLTPNRKDELVEALHPYCTTAADVLGLDDLEGYLAQNPSIERAHLKLWLCSFVVLERLLQGALRTRSEIRLEQLLDKSRYYVPHASISEAEEKLRQHKCLVISGPPGIGKTTMAEMLALQFLADDFEVHFVASVSEVEGVMGGDNRKLLVFDDFLGRTNLFDAPSGTEQDRLVTAMNYYSKKSGTYFVLTTREYILRQAQNINDRLSDDSIEFRKCILDISGYDRSKRARILYNHMYFAEGLPEDSVREFVRQEGYWDIIDHPNFNPRWIDDTLRRLSLSTPG